MQEKPKFTPRNVAKHVATAVVAMKVNAVTKTAIADHTRFEEDDTIVKIAGGVAGWYVSDKVKPYTDKAVDTVADKIEARRAKKAAKQDRTEK